MEATGGPRVSFLAKNTLERGFPELQRRLKELVVVGHCSRKEMGLKNSPGAYKKQALCISEEKERLEGVVGTRGIFVGPMGNGRRFCEIKSWKPR